jgi:methionyl-tRNA formyltransferase
VLHKITQKLYHVESSYLKEVLNKKLIPKKIDYIICFRSYYILDLEIINRAKYGAINFHPSPPKYRGVGGINYALYANDKYYGSTAHIIDRKIDNGNIIDVKNFKISKTDNLDSLLNKCHSNMLNQASLIVKQLKRNDVYLTNKIKKSIKYRWGKYRNLKQLNDFYELNKDITKIELKKKIRLTVTRGYKPYINLHNNRFYLK